VFPRDDSADPFCAAHLQMRNSNSLQKTAVSVDYATLLLDAISRATYCSDLKLSSGYDAAI
jgi:hypothetical protein